MGKWRGEVRRDSGKLLLVLIAVVILVLLGIVMWQSQRATMQTPAPVPNSQPVR